MDQIKVGRQVVRSDEQVIEVLRKVKAGSHPADVAKEVGVGVQSVYHWCSLAGVTYAHKVKAKRDWEKIKALL